ncbi:gamma-glutamylcyclotransferase [Neorhizobium lilium]|uniref:glutathione-specific gamma-glutamylcyclotransferase n=1 Tax=Neorhizobium lilium TaxID=2503024 RepID=A0A444L9X0_9HYPH|nr:gamma-glutamylcyclotransferase [Neorhizobium lilium]RWX74398.1 gamma-glutamylcyclotransferase [Neorhizobium lilium]
MARDMDEFWVFGYRSLMWNPGFVFEERIPARVFGFRRSLCVWSHVHRGTPQQPGLVLGLDRGGSCLGVAFRVSDGQRVEVLNYLRRRELVTNVYLERVLPASLQDRRQVRAVSYIVDRHHPQYAGALAVEDAAEVVYRSHGQSGPNQAYVSNTLAHMKEMGIRDPWLERVSAAVSDCAQAAG